MKTVLLTGATGFLGSHAAPLLAQSMEVRAIVRDVSRLPPSCTGLQADLMDAASLRAIAAGMDGCATLVHLAAAMPVASRSAIEEEQAQRKQFDGLENLLRLLPLTIEHIVYASSIDVYGVPQSLSITEEHPTQPVTTYGKMKLESEVLLREFAAKRKIPLAVLRITQIYGPGEAPIKAIPLFIQAILNREPPTLFGDGSDERDYIFVKDAARAIAQAVEKKADGIFNITSGKSTALRETLDAIIELSGRRLQPVYKERAKPKLDFSFEVSKAKNTLGFEAVTPLREGLKAEYDWFASRV